MKNGSLWLTRSYNFVDKDPECDRFRTLRQKEKINDKEVAVLAGLAVATVRNLFEGKTRAPRHATFAKLAAAWGYRYDLVRDGPPNYGEELPRAWEQYRAHKEKARVKRKGQAKKKAKKG